MYNFREIQENLYWIGVNDRRLQRFENMFPLESGVVYNSYVILDEKNVVMDAVDANAVEQYLENIKQLLLGKKLDYLVVQHAEPDHCSSIVAILKTYPETKIVCNQKTINLLTQFYDFDFEDRYVLVKDGDELSLGERTLKFYFAPMVHWPEVMMTYEKRDQIFFSADAFGAFGALAGNLFTDQVDYEKDWLDEARRYYINIVGKHGASVQRLFKKIADLEIKLLCPLHGLLFRGEEIKRILKLYQTWSSFEAEEKGIVLAYSTMYGNTQLVMEILAGELADLGVRNIKMYDVSQTHLSYIISDLYRYSHAIFGVINYNTELYFGMDSLLRELVSNNYQKRSVSLVTNLSWGGKALKVASDILAPIKELKYLGEPLVVKSCLKAEQMAEVKALAKVIAADLLS